MYPVHLDDLDALGLGRSRLHELQAKDARKRAEGLARHRARLAQRHRLEDQEGFAESMRALSLEARIFPTRWH